MHYVAQVDASLADRLAIRDVVETWANARDSGDWDAFRACWHEDGYMMATWFQGPKEDFIRVSQEGIGPRGQHPALHRRLPDHARTGRGPSPRPG